jgi:T5SS/PEP-CTERM-associated repeat protein
VSSSTAVVGQNSGGTGNVLINAGNFQNTGSLGIGVGGTGSVTLSNGGVLTSGDTTVGAHGSLLIDPSTVDVNGNLTLSPGGDLELDIDQTGASQINITGGNGLFQGTVNIDFINGFTPTPGSAFDLVTATGGTLDFSQATINLVGLNNPGLRYQFDFLPTDFSLDISSPEPNSGLLFTAAAIFLCAIGAWRKSSKK